MSKFLEVTVRIPIREEYQDDERVLRHVASAIEVCHMDDLGIDAGLCLNEGFIADIGDSVLVSSLAHVKSAEVVEITIP